MKTHHIQTSILKGWLPLAIVLLVAAFGYTGLRSVSAAPTAVGFDASGLAGESSNNPTSLQFGPEGRLYVSQQDGTIYAYTILRNAANDYDVTNTETINLVKNIPNHNDDGSPASNSNRQVTGLLATGTYTNPVLYVTSSDPRIGAGTGGTDLGFDTNSGVVSRLECVGGINVSNQCSSWEKIDIIRGLPRSEENHAPNGMALDETTNTLYITAGGHTNAGSPSNNFAFTIEYAYSAAILTADLNTLLSLPTLTDSDGVDYKYNLPTLDDPTGVSDPWGGDDGLNQAIIDPLGPVQLYATGFRNPYDVVLTEAGRLYSVDNGANSNWGGYPEYEESYDCTNNYLPGEPGSTGDGPDPSTYPPSVTLHDGLNGTVASDNAPDVLVNNKNGLHLVTQGYYAGHPHPLRGNPAGAGIYYNGVFYEPGNVNLPATWPPVPVSMANPVECDFQNSGVDDGTMANYGPSTNGITEYTASNFGGAMQGYLLVASYNGVIYQVELNATGDVAVNCPTNPEINCQGSDDIFASGFGSIPLDVHAVGDDGVFPGTVWAVTYGSDTITIFEPNDYDGGSGGVCTGADDNLIDEDNDGYTNADEIDNGTNPCSGASQPNDFDGTLIGGFLVSDLNDPDDDDDTLTDTQDVFPLDPNNGTTTSLPLRNDLFNDGEGFFNLGFTGLMSNGDDYLTLIDDIDETNGNARQLIAGGTAGLYTDTAVGPGDAFQAGNTQLNAFQFGIDVDTGTGPFTIRTRTAGDYFNGAGQNFQATGVYIGTGDQDNYVKFVINDGSGAAGAGGFQLLKEQTGATTETSGNAAGIFTEVWVDLYLTVNPSTGVVDAYYVRSSAPTTLVSFGSTTVTAGPLLDAIQGTYQINSVPSALAYGFISTSFGPGPTFPVTYDFIEIIANTPGELGATPTTLDFGTVVPGGSGLESLVLTNNGAPADGNITVSSIAFTGADGGLFASTLSSPVTLLPMESTIVDVTFSPLVEGPATASLEVTHDGSNTSPLPIAIVAAGQGEPEPLVCINANGAAYTGVDRTFLADQFFTGGLTFGTPGSPAIANTVDDTIYQTERYGDFSYSIPVSAPGNYFVEIHLAEIYHGVNPNGGGAGARLFDIEVEGSLVLNDYDIFTEVGPATAITQTFPATTADATVDVTFITELDNAKVSAICILSDGSPVNNPPVVDPIPNQFNLEGDDIASEGLSVSAVDNETLAYSATGLPPGVQLEPTNGQFLGIVQAGAAANSPYSVVVSVDDGTNLPVTTSFTWTISDGPTSGGTVLYRVNAGGPQVAAADASAPDWSVDTNASPSPYRTGGPNFYSAASPSAHPGPINMSSPTLPPSAPVDIFEIERWDPAALPEMSWAFPVPAGTQVEVRLFFAELFGGVTAAGQRVFDASVEGVVPTEFDDIDPFGLSGAKGAIMLSTTAVVDGDGTLDIVFLHDVIENPALKGIEIIDITPVGNPSALVEVLPGNGNINSSTFGSDSFQITNTGDVTITSVTIDLSTTFMPDIVFDPVGAAGDNTAKCLTIDTVSGTPGYVTPTDPCVDPFSGPHDGGYDVATLNFTDFNAGEQLNFSVDIDPTSIQNDVTAGDAGSVSGLELAGATVTVEFANGQTLVSSLYEDGSIGGSQTVVTSTLPAAPTLSLVGVPVVPTTLTVPTQTLQINGPANAYFSVLHTDARLYIDAGGGGFDLDPFEANTIMDKVLFSGQLDGSGQALVPVTLLQTTSTDAGPDGGLNHFIAVTSDAPYAVDQPTSQTSTPLVVEYDPGASVATITIASPLDGATVLTDSLTVTWTAVTPETNDHVHVTLDDLPYIGGQPVNGSYTFNNVLPGPHTLTVEVADFAHVLYTNPEASDSVDVIVDYDLPLCTNPTVAINSGSTTAYTAGNGTVFAADAFFTASNTFSSGQPIAYTADDTLFQTERWGNPFSYNIPVANGDYIVELYMAELFFGVPNARVFSIDLEGNTVTSNIDLANTLGNFGATLFSYPVSITDGSVDLDFAATVNNAKVNGICIYPSSQSINLPPVVDNPGTQFNTEGDLVTLPITATPPEITQTLTYSATGLPTGLSIDPVTGIITGTLDPGTSGVAGAAIESGGVVVVEIESQPPVTQWDDSGNPSDIPSPIPGAIGTYYEWKHGDTATGINSANQNNAMSYLVEINTPGLYRFQWRNASPNPNADYNDSWLKVTGGSSQAYARVGDPNSPISNVNLGNSFFKVWSPVAADAWNWTANHVDFNAHQVYMEFPTAGIYTIDIAGRSSQHKLDRFVLYEVSQSFSEAQLDGLAASAFTTGGTPGAADNSPYSVTVTATDDGSPALASQQTFQWFVSELGTGTNPQAQIAINPGGGINASTFGNNSFQISNTGDTDIIEVEFDISSTFMPDIVFDPVGTAGDNTAKCLTPNNTVGTPGFVTPANPCTEPFSQPHDGSSNNEGYDVLSMAFTDFNPGEQFNFSVDIDPTSIKNDITAGDAGSVSGLELSGADVTITFANGLTITTSIFEDGSLGGGQALAALNAPAAPIIAMQNITTTPTLTPDINQTVIVTGTPGASIVLMQVDARLYIDSGGGGYDLDLFEANTAVAKVVYNATIEPDGDVAIPVTLLKSNSIDAGPDGGINHFVAVLDTPGIQTSLTSNVLVVEYDPTAADPALIFVPSSLNFAMLSNSSDSQDFIVSTNNNTTLPGNAPLVMTDTVTNLPPTWLTTAPSAAQNVPVSAVVDSTGLPTGQYTATISAGPVAGYASTTMTVTLTVAEQGQGTAYVAIDTGNDIAGSTYGGGFIVTNQSGNGLDIDSVTFDLSTTIYPNMVYDPNGTAGDATGKCLTPVSGEVATGYIDPTNPCIDPFSGPKGNGGWTMATINFTDFGVGETFEFSVDVDPTSMAGITTTGGAGSVSGLELMGATVTIQYSDSSIQVVEVYRVQPSSNGGSENVASPAALSAAPTLEIQGLPVNPGDAVITDTNQILELSGPAGANASILIIESEIIGGNVITDPFEANNAQVVTEIDTVIGAGGSVTVPVTLGDAAAGDLYYITAVIVEPDGRTSDLSEVWRLQLDPSATIGGFDGDFTLQARSVYSGEVTLSFYQVGAATPDYVFTPMADGSGTFNITGLAPGTYEVALKHPMFLQVVDTIVVGSGSNSFDFGEMVAGDGNNNNVIDIGDYAMVINSFGSIAGGPNWLPMADFNGNGTIDIGDYAIVTTNFGTIGEIPSGS